MTFSSNSNSSSTKVAASQPAVDWSCVDWEQLVDQLKNDIGSLVDSCDLDSASKLINEIQHLVSPEFLEAAEFEEVLNNQVTTKPDLISSQTSPSVDPKSKDASYLLEQVLNRIVDPVLILDEENRVQFTNQSFRRLSPNLLQSKATVSDRELLKAIFSAVPRDKSQRDTLATLVNPKQPSGQVGLTIHDHPMVVRWFEVDLPLDKKGRVYLFGDDTEELQSLLQIDCINASATDCKIHSRKQLLEELEFLIQNDNRLDITNAVYIVDIDDFKLVNDSIGYLLGDKLLGQVAQRISEAIDVPHSVGKLSGDEFCVLVRDIKNLNMIPAVGNAINKSCAKSFVVNGQETHISVSIGVSVIRPDNYCAESVIQQADLAMYQAKQMGGNCYCFYNEDVRQRIQDRFFIRNEMRKAIARDEFQMYYQPKLDLRTGKLGGAEALIRWVRNGQFFRSPGEFIAEAETCGLILSISNLVFDQVARDMERWKKKGLPVVPTSLNVSPSHFKIGDPVADLQKAFRRHRVDTSLVEVEVTENVFLDNLDFVVSQLNQIRDNGFKVSIDDFGVGCNSLAYLKKLPINALKLDRSFISGVADCEFDSTLVESMINIAHSLDQVVIAEGVESKIVADHLDKMNCDYIQGYWYAKPVSVQQFEEEYLKNFQ